MCPAAPSPTELFLEQFSEKSATAHVARHLSGSGPVQVPRTPTSPWIPPGSCKGETETRQYQMRYGLGVWKALVASRAPG